MNIIGVAGPARHGKTTVGDILVRDHGFAIVNLADPIKRALQSIYDFTDDQLWGSKKDKPDFRYLRREIRKELFMGDDPVIEKEYLTPRWAMQFLGTEIGRELCADTWVKKAIETARCLLEQDAKRPPVGPTGARTLGGYDPRYGLAVDVSAQWLGVAIPDVRFRNELDAIRAAGGVVWWRERASVGQALGEEAGKHASENSLRAEDCDAQITIDTTIEDLTVVVKKYHGVMKNMKELK